MIVPNKAVPIKESVIYKMLSIMDLEFSAISVSALYAEVSGKFDGITDFVYALDVLFLLGKIEFDEAAGILFKC